VDIDVLYVALLIVAGVFFGVAAVNHPSTVRFNLVAAGLLVAVVVPICALIDSL
jgi:hypothetical protein